MLGAGRVHNHLAGDKMACLEIGEQGSEVREGSTLVLFPDQAIQGIQGSHRLQATLFPALALRAVRIDNRMANFAGA